MFAECIKTIHAHASLNADNNLLSKLEKSVVVNISALEGIGVDYEPCPEYHVEPNIAMVDLNQAERFSFYLMGILGSATVFLGLVVNILALTHLTIYKHNLGPRYGYIIGMSIWDNCLLLSGWVTLCLSILIGRGHVVTHGHLILISRYGQVVMNISMLGVIWSTTAVTIERYFAVCRPSRHAIRRTMRRSKWWFPVTALILSVYNMPRFFEIAVSFCCDIDTLSLVPHAGVAPFAKPGSAYFIWYKTVASAFLVTLAPFLVLTGLTVKIVLRIRETKKIDNYYLVQMADQQFTGVGSQSSQATYTSISTDPVKQKQRGLVNRSLILIVLKFIACHTLCTINDLIQCLAGQEGVHVIPWFIYFVEFGDFLVLLHSSTSGLIFLLLSRRTLLRNTPNEVQVEPVRPNHDTLISKVPAPAPVKPVSSEKEDRMKEEAPALDLMMTSLDV